MYYANLIKLVIGIERYVVNEKILIFCYELLMDSRNFLFPLLLLYLLEKRRTKYHLILFNQIASSDHNNSVPTIMKYLLSRKLQKLNEVNLKMTMMSENLGISVYNSIQDIIQDDFQSCLSPFLAVKQTTLVFFFCGFQLRIVSSFKLSSSLFKTKFKSISFNSIPISLFKLSLL